MIQLKKFSETHLLNTFDWMQVPDFKKLFLLDREITKDGHRNWFRRMKQDDSQRVFAIIYKESHVGNVGMKNIDVKNKKAEIWIYIGDANFKGKGLATKALVTLNKEFKGEFQKFYAQIADFNIASLKTFFRAGYKMEGLLINELFFKGENVNLFRLYVLL